MLRPLSTIFTDHIPPLPDDSVPWTFFHSNQSRTSRKSPLLSRHDWITKLRNQSLHNSHHNHHVLHLLLYCHRRPRHPRHGGIYVCQYDLARSRRSKLSLSLDAGTRMGTNTLHTTVRRTTRHDPRGSLSIC